ncbi:hypothetical protein H6P81_004540 [Aristolochia fimbriata]|uniref:Uncharacterized protein n=1 Tax=Aristolochia fimbriata TaxID=158543 RepID=A0AAV7FHT4_ARIFI|nr:hypothetical protein H6P81_004540 [Aristolochia fimbriata]
MLTRLLLPTELQRTLLKIIFQGHTYRINRKLLPVQQCLEQDGCNRARDDRVHGVLHWVIDIGEHQVDCFFPEKTAEEVAKSTDFEAASVGCGAEESPPQSLADTIAEGLWDLYFGGYSRWQYRSSVEYEEDSEEKGIRQKW